MPNEEPKRVVELRKKGYQVKVQGNLLVAVKGGERIEEKIK